MVFIPTEFSVAADSAKLVSTIPNSCGSVVFSGGIQRPSCAQRLNDRALLSIRIVKLEDGYRARGELRDHQPTQALFDSQRGASFVLGHAGAGKRP